MKFFPLILITVLILTGCVPKPLRPAVHDEIRQQDTFFRFIDAETSNDRKQALQTLQNEFPQNALTARASKLDAARSEQQAKINTLTAELKRCRKESTQRETNNAALRKDLQQLKQLVIEMEMRAR